MIAVSLAHRLDSEVRHERRRILGAMVAVAFAMLVGWTLTLGAHFTGIKPLHSLALVSALADSLIYLVFFVLAARSVRRIQAEIEAMGGTLLSSVTASLRTIDSRIRDTTLAARCLPVAALVSALLLATKYRAGELRGLGAAVGSAGAFVFAGAIVAAMAWRYKTHLLPRREELRRLLASLEDTP